MNLAIGLLIAILGGLFGILSLVALIVGWFLFRHVIKAQWQRWFLAKRGYVEVEHVSPTRIRNYFYMKPKDGKFDIYDGFYHYMSEAVTQGREAFKKYEAIDREFKSMSKEDFDKLTEEQKKKYRDDEKAWKDELAQREKLAAAIADLKFKNENTTWKWGMPVITYYGDNPDPIDFSKRDKTFGSGVIKDMYIRLLLTQRYKDFQLILMIVTIAIVAFAVAAIAIWFKMNGMAKVDANQLSYCLVMLNQSQSAVQNYLMQTAVIAAQNSTIII